MTERRTNERTNERTYVRRTNGRMEKRKLYTPTYFVCRGYNKHFPYCYCSIPMVLQWKTRFVHTKFFTMIFLYFYCPFSITTHCVHFLKHRYNAPAVAHTFCGCLFIPCRTFITYCKRLKSRHSVNIFIISTHIYLLVDGNNSYISFRNEAD